LFSGLIR